MVTTKVEGGSHQMAQPVNSLITLDESGRRSLTPDTKTAARISASRCPISFEPLYRFENWTLRKLLFLMHDTRQYILVHDW
jgi:hypothetical protein